MKISGIKEVSKMSLIVPNTTRSSCSFHCQIQRTYDFFILHTKKGRDCLQIEGFGISSTSQEISFSTYTVLCEDHQ